jgi:hypothetical protein
MSRPGIRDAALIGRLKAAADMNSAAAAADASFAAEKISVIPLSGQLVLKLILF